MSPITSNPNLTVHVCLLKGIKNEQQMNGTDPLQRKSIYKVTFIYWYVTELLQGMQMEFSCASVSWLTWHVAWRYVHIRCA